VSIEQFGYYTVAANVASGALQLIYPLTLALLPRAMQLHSQPEALRALSLKLTGIIALITAMAVLVFCLSGEWLLTVWLRTPHTAMAIYPLLAVLLIGTALNAFYNVGYINWLVHEKTQRVLQVNALALLLALSLIPSLVTTYGVMGAAFGWLSINSIGLILSLEWLKTTSHEKTP
jgi:O-antigen/teichoic acid export membrane protein